ncbi:MAG: T9SS type A sorting domain-containing protein [Bacteroidota bacterium]
MMAILSPYMVLGQTCNGPSSVQENTGLPAGFDLGTLVIESIELPFPSFIFPVDTHEVYVFGGQPLGLDLYKNIILTGEPGNPDLAYYAQFSPYVVKVDPETMDTVYLDLSGGSGIPYVGGLADHPNGYLYAVAQARIFQIDPVDMSIVNFIDMPVEDQSTVYNGLNVASNGLIITKSANFGEFSQGSFWVVDANSLEILSELKLEAGSARLSFDCDSLGNEYVYHLNQNFTFRMLVTEDSLIVDSTWIAAYAPYGPGNNTEPTSPKIANNRVHYTTNTSFADATQAMKIFWQSTESSYSLEEDTLDGFFMFSDTITTGFDFFGLTLDEETGVIIGHDQANGKIAAYEISEQEELVYLWEKEVNVSSGTNIVEGIVYVNDYNREEEVDYLLMLDLMSGAELGRIATPGTVPTISLPSPGYLGDIYFCSNEAGQPLGFFSRVSVDTSSVTSVKDLTSSTTVTAIRNYPNPFSEETTIAFELLNSAQVVIEVFNVLGKQVEVLTNEKYTSGSHSVVFDGSRYESGLYFYRVNVDGYSEVSSIVINR